MGVVYRLCEALLARLPADQDGRRVFAETLADWRQEPQAIRGLLAVVRAVAGVSIREVVSASMFRILMQVMAWSTGWALLGIVLSRVAYGWTLRPVSELAAWSVVGVVFFFPTAVLLSSATRRRGVPVLGLVLASAVAALLLVGWAMPAANRATFGAVDMFTLGGLAVQEPAADGVEQVVRMFAPRTSLEYISGRYAHDLPALVAAGPPNGWPAIQQVSFSAAFVCLCALVPLIGYALSHSRAWSRQAAMFLTVAFVLYRGQIADVVAPDWVLWSFVAPWLPVAIIAAATPWACGLRGPRNYGTSGPR